MSFNPHQFRTVIRSALGRLGEGYATDAAIELLMLTAAQETHLGTYLYQVNLAPENGGACGVFQMEPATHDDVQLRLIVQRGRFSWMPLADAEAMIWDLRYAIWMARIYYAQFIEALPAADDVRAMAEYYKEYWNTDAGAATVDQAIENYHRYAVNKY